MKKLIIFLSFALICRISLFSQEAIDGLKNYNWEEKRKYIPMTPEDEQTPEIIELSKSYYEYTEENGDFTLYSLDHMIIKVNTDDAIEANNTISIPMSDASELVNLKVRTITEDGKITLSDISNIKEIKNDENNKMYRKFAIEGIEKGCEVEYFYILKGTPITYGGVAFQFSSPVKKEFFQLVAPDYLMFKFKGYNGFPEIKDTIIDNKKIYFSQIANVNEIDNEAYSNFAKNRMRVEFKYACNLSTSKKELNRWTDFVQNKYSQISTLSSKEQKAVKKIYQSLDINDKDLETKVRTIENYIKSNIVIQEVYAEEYNTLDKILYNKFGSQYGIVKLYSALFKFANVQNQLVVTSKRTKVPFDGSFESWRFLNNYLFYIVGTNQFLSPEETNFRYPLIPHELTYTDGLFFKEVSVGGLETAIPVINFIPPLNYKSTVQNINAEISFLKNMDETHLKLNCSLTGYNATDVRPFYSQISDDKKQEMLENFVKYIIKDKNFISLKAENTDPNLSPIDKPFVVQAEVDGNTLLERAGDKVLLKVGEVLGEQMELYQEKKRKLNVECDYNREYLRKIKIDIPDGYIIKNPDDIKINRGFEKDGKRVYSFISDYKIENNSLTIDIDEFYDLIECPVENFEEYRKVVNAAADFNKVVLIFQPKS